MWFSGAVKSVLDNAQFDLVIATALGLGLAFDRIAVSALGRRLRRDHGAYRRSWRDCSPARRDARYESALVLFNPDYRAEYYLNAAVVREDAARIAQIPGPVACDYKVVCRMAGKPFSYDDFHTEMLVATGASHGLDVQGLIRAHGITYVENDPRDGIEALFRSIGDAPREGP